MLSSSGLSGTDGLAFSFKVSISGGNNRGGDSGSLSFTSCDGIQGEVEVQFLNDGSSLERAVSVRGRRVGGIISFSQGVTEGGAASDYFQWFQQVCDPSIPLKKRILNVMLSQSDQGGKVISKWIINGAWPCKWVGPLLEIQSHSPAIERLSFAFDSIEKG